MAKRQHLVHLHSTSKVGSLTGLTAANLQVGELAMYNPAAASAVTMYALNSDKTGLAEFKTDAYYQATIKTAKDGAISTATGYTETNYTPKGATGDSSGTTSYYGVKKYAEQIAASKVSTHNSTNIVTNEGKSDYVTVNATTTGHSMTFEVKDTISANFAAKGHKHVADDITGGTFNIARIPTGTSSTTVARGDHSHAYIATNKTATFELKGDVTGSVTTGLSATTISINTTVGDDTHNHSTSTITGTLTGKSQVTSAATGLTQGKAVYDYVTDYAAPKHSHPYLPNTQQLTVKLTDDVTGEATIDVSAKTMSISTTVVNNSHTHTSANITDSISAGSSITSSATKLVQGKAVYEYVDTKFQANDAMLFKGTVTGETSFPTTFQAGWTYKVATAGTYFGQPFEIGDMVIAIKDATTATTTTSANFAEYWTAIQTNTDGHVTGPASSTNGNFPLFDGTTGKLIKNSSYSPSSFAAASHTSSLADTGTTGHTALVSGDVSSITSYSKAKAAASYHNHNAAYAPKNQTLAVELKGDVTGSATSGITGGTISINTTVADNSHNHTSANISDSISAGTSITSAQTKLVQGRAVWDYAAPKSHTHSYLDKNQQFEVKLSGDMTGSATAYLSAGTVTVAATANAKFVQSGHTIESATTTTLGHAKLQGGDLSAYTATTVTAGLAAAAHHTHSQYANKSHSHGTVKLTGDATGSASFTNTGCSITTTVAGLASKLSSVSITMKEGGDNGVIANQSYTVTTAATAFDLTKISIDCGEY